MARRWDRKQAGEAGEEPEIEDHESDGGQVVARPARPHVGGRRDQPPPDRDGDADQRNADHHAGPEGITGRGSCSPAGHQRDQRRAEALAAERQDQLTDGPGDGKGEEDDEGGTNDVEREDKRPTEQEADADGRGQIAAGA